MLTNIGGVISKNIKFQSLVIVIKTSNGDIDGSSQDSSGRTVRKILTEEMMALKRTRRP